MPRCALHFAVRAFIFSAICSVAVVSARFRSARQGPARDAAESSSGRFRRRMSRCPSLRRKPPPVRAGRESGIEEMYDVATVADQISEAVPDVRLAESRHVHTPWTLANYSTVTAWEARAARIRRHLLVVTGLHPLPEKSPLNPRVFGRLERAGYAVEKVFFESLPGFLVCGNLYSPLGTGPHPGIACPHGHCRRGRLENDDTDIRFHTGTLHQPGPPGACCLFVRHGGV